MGSQVSRFIDCIEDPEAQTQYTWSQMSVNDVKFASKLQNQTTTTISASTPSDDTDSVEHLLRCDETDYSDYIHASERKSVELLHMLVNKVNKCNQQPFIKKMKIADQQDLSLEVMNDEENDRYYYNFDNYQHQDNHIFESDSCSNEQEEEQAISPVLSNTRYEHKINFSLSDSINFTDTDTDTETGRFSFVPF